jgi:transposase
MDHVIQGSLNWPDVRVLSTHRTEPGPWLLRIARTLEGTRGRRGGRESRDLHGGDAVVRRRHLPRFDGPVLIEGRPKRSRCPYRTGTPTTTPRGAWYEPRSPNTKADEQGTVRLLINATVTDAARKLGGSAESIAGLRDHGSERAVAWAAWERLGVIGLDASALQRGHRDGVVGGTVPREGGGVESLAVLAARQKETGAAFLGAIPAQLRHTIERACPDMYAGFGRAIEEEVPWAESGIERFHGARADRDGADTGRKQELKRRKRVRPTAEEAELKGARWPFRSRPADRKAAAWGLRERVFTHAPKIEAAYHLREDRTEWFEHDDTKGGAKSAIRAWCKRVGASGRAEFEGFLGTIERGLEEIANEVQGRQTSGLVEGFNHRVQVLKRRCYGIFDVGRLFQRLTLDLHGYQRCGHTCSHALWWSTTAIPGEPIFVEWIV